MKKTWSDLEAELTSAWRETVERGGSFSDGPCESGIDFDSTLSPILTLEQKASEALVGWIDTGFLPQMSPGANRYAQMHLTCALGLIRHLRNLPSFSSPPDWPHEEIYRWLLFTVYADTMQIALDTMRADLLGATE
jgi:hypothetical protein